MAEADMNIDKPLPKENDPYQEIIEQCYLAVLEKSKQHKPLLVSMTGDSGSGKSHYSKMLREKMSAEGIKFSYIDADDFLISRKDREPMKTDFYTEGEFSGKSKWEILENMFRLDVMTQVIESLRRGEPVAYQPYQRSTGEVSAEIKTIEPADIIIFDSSMLTDQMDFVIRVDVDREKILQRKIERDKDIRTPEQVVEMHNKVQGYYWDRKAPQNPDILIDNNDFAQPKLEIRNK